MVEEFDEFCFAGHQPGDYDIISDEQYSGYHLIYFVGEGEPYSRILADGELRGAAYNEALSGLTEGFTAERAFMWRYVMSK